MFTSSVVWEEINQLDLFSYRPAFTGDLNTRVLQRALFTESSTELYAAVNSARRQTCRSYNFKTVTEGRPDVLTALLKVLLKPRGDV